MDLWVMGARPIAVVLVERPSFQALQEGRTLLMVAAVTRRYPTQAMGNLDWQMEALVEEAAAGTQALVAGGTVEDRATL